MEEIFSAVFGEVIAFLVLAPIGVAYLFLRYRNKARVQKELASEYENSYTNVGRVVVLNTIAALLSLAMAALVILAIVTPILNWMRV
ncbi:hypothetical protein [Hymenobacter antarcticus]